MAEGGGTNVRSVKGKPMELRYDDLLLRYEKLTRRNGELIRDYYEMRKELFEVREKAIGLGMIVFVESIILGFLGAVYMIGG